MLRPRRLARPRTLAGRGRRSGAAGEACGGGKAVVQRILVVEDSPTILNLLSLMLRQEGFEVVTARDGLEALEQLDQAPAQLVITDVNMPRMDGFKLIREVRRRPGGGRLPIIVVSTEREGHDQSQGLDAGADVYLTKPIQPGALLEHVRELLRPEADSP
jgi:DNA-binding response OmpR family regulator